MCRVAFLTDKLYLSFIPPNMFILSLEAAEEFCTSFASVLRAARKTYRHVLTDPDVDGGLWCVGSACLGINQTG